MKHRVLVSLVALSTLGFWADKAYSQPSGRTGPAAISPFLEGADCRTFSSRGEEYILLKGDVEIPVRRQLYTSRFRLRSIFSHSGTLVCKTDSRYDTLELQMAIPDTVAFANPIMTANIYQGGNLVHTYSNLVSGDIVGVTLDLVNPTIAQPDDVAIELVCHDAGGNELDRCYLHFTEALLIGGENFPLRLPQSSTSNSYETASIQQLPSSWKDVENIFEDLGDDATEDLFDLF